MFKPEDFNLTLENELKLRLVYDEVDACTDIDSLRSHLKDSVRLAMNYQKIISTLIQEQIMKDLSDFTDLALEISEGKD